ncbi:hypothetical protein [Actinomadura logoneensis]|uniref:hypothetical protein n=1 Tax=Actinomadura logoneensis TaxID=2293572 RepID=UPI00131498B1|nr:hypothetical protein [Actinomadura logoneensis]
MRKHTHDLAAVESAAAPRPRTRGAELRRLPSDQRARGRQQAKGVRLVPRRRGY